MKSREEEILELIAESNEKKKSYQKLVWKYASAESATDFDRWLKNRISLEIELFDVRKKHGKN